MLYNEYGLNVRQNRAGPDLQSKMNAQPPYNISVRLPSRNHNLRCIVCVFPAVSLLHCVEVLLDLWVVPQLVPSLWHWQHCNCQHAPISHRVKILILALITHGIILQSNLP